MREHLGGPTPGVLLHGDLLRQNLRILPDEAPGVLDWRLLRSAILLLIWRSSHVGSGGR